MKLINESDNEFTDISSEEWREYGSIKDLGQINAIALSVSKSGGHRLFDGEFCYYIQPKEGWYIKWKTKDGQPHFVK